MSTNFQQLVPPYAAFTHQPPATNHPPPTISQGGGSFVASLTAFSMERKYLLEGASSAPPLSMAFLFLFFTINVCLGFSLFISLAQQFPFTLVHQMGILCVCRATASLFGFQLAADCLATCHDRRGLPTRLQTLQPASDTQTNCQPAEAEAEAEAAHLPDLQLMDSTLFTICNRFAVKFCSDTSFIVFSDEHERWGNKSPQLGWILSN